MRMSRLVLVFMVLLMSIWVAMSLACAGGDDEEEAWGLDSSAAAPRAAPVMESPALLATAAPAPAPTMAPTAAPAPAVYGAGEGEAGDSLKVQASPQTQTRVIVHTAYMSLVVGQIAASVDWIAGLAQALGGWVVSSDRTSMHGGAISIRVPAATLEEALAQLEGMAVEVESRMVTSQDVTDQYVDYQSRLASMKATEQRLLSFLNSATEVEDALEVHKELAELQVQIEEIQGRLNFLTQTAAFSLIDVSLKLTPQIVQVDAGEDVGVKVGRPARFRASFVPPAGIDEYEFIWDFGDGTTTRGNGTILRPDGRRVTATVNHVYQDDGDSPYIARIELSGFGESGVAEGEDAIEVSVSEVPSIEVFAEGQTVEEGQEVEYTASFLRPEELWDYTYKWDFGDGSPTVTGMPEEGSTRLSVRHAYADYRPGGYEGEVTVSAMSDGGEVTGTAVYWVGVTESKGLIVGGWEVGDTAKSAVRALSAVARVAVMALIWLLIFSPVIAIVAGIVYVIRRIDRKYRPVRKSASARESDPLGPDSPLAPRRTQSGRAPETPETDGSDK